MVDYMSSRRPCGQPTPPVVDNADLGRRRQPLIGPLPVFIGLPVIGTVVDPVIVAIRIGKGPAPAFAAVFGKCNDFMSACIQALPKTLEENKYHCPADSKHTALQQAFDAGGQDEKECNYFLV